MKTKHFLIATVAALAMLSCSSEEKTPGQEEAGRSKLSIRILGEAEAPKGRAAGTTDPTAESKINNFILFVFKEGGANDVVPKEYTSTPTEAVSHEITTDAKEVYVIANTSVAGETQSPMHTALLNVKNKTELQAVIGRGFDTAVNTANPSQTATNLWMSGKNDADFTPEDGGSVSVTVTLKYIAAKVRIKSVTVDESTPELYLTNVLVLNAGGATSLIPADGSVSLIPTAYVPGKPGNQFYEGAIDISGFTHKPTIAGLKNAYSYILTGEEPKTITESSNQHYFYVFENDGEAFEKHPTIVTLQCMDGNSKAVYYSVFFKADPDGTLGYDKQVIERGNSYDITMTIKKIGPNDPTIPALKTTVEVTITPAKWETVTIAKTYE